MRAHFYKGLILRLQNRWDEAIQELEPVVAAYPQFRQARQELGYAYFLEKRYAPAREQFEALQQINPDDLSAHYYLSLIYSSLGMKQEAAREGALYSEHRDDPGAQLLGLDFRYKHAEVAHESEPYHVHDKSGTLLRNTAASVPAASDASKNHAPQDAHVSMCNHKKGIPELDSD
jgi:tetratricopeptide (TPR) repeat protein